ncbi:MAG: STAS/SEC14 domain-containing protein [Candidatus Thiodiazotropha sp. 6PLUC2]
MHDLDTGKLTLTIEDNRYVAAVIYTNGELVKDDVKQITDYLDRFNEPIPVLIERKGHYSISVLVQIVLMQQTKSRLKAVAFVERNHRDALMTRIASSTYFKEIEVKSFYDKDEAVEWLKQNYATSPLIAEE